MQSRKAWFRRDFDLRHLIGLLLGLALLAAAGLPAWFNRPDVTLANAADLLVIDLRCAQNLAVVRSSPTFVVLDPGGYEVVDADGAVLDNPRTEQPFVRRWDRDAVFRGVELSKLALADGGNRISFDRNGYVQPGGDVWLSFRGERRRVWIEAPRGLLSVVETEPHR
ncbi:MAG: hypothetical protein GC161_16200 [Planctomycetaceae bacterium]|nr:hypothetical protein [Planctomycetaceae bacterium]